MQSDDNKTIKICLFVGALILALAYSCAKKDEDAPKTCETICVQQGGRDSGYGFTWYGLVECNCVINN